MNIEVVSGSRADYGAAQAVHEALKQRGVNPSLREAQASPFKHTSSEIVVLVGDRFETLQYAVEAYINGKVIAHLSGGDITEGSKDDSMRHAITKLSHLHFCTNEESARRVIQMGEEPWRVYNVGCPAIDTLKATKIIEDKFILVVWHPNTLGDTETETKELMWGLEGITHHRDLKVIIIGPNADAGNDIVRRHLKDWAAITYKAKYTEEVDRQEYINLLANAQALVGNSSSGFYEAPTFNTPVVNIGDRQKGRFEPANLITCAAKKDAITAVLEATLEAGRPKHNIQNPYGDGKSAERIAEILCNTKDPKTLLRKCFHVVQGLGCYSSTPGVGKVPQRGTSKMDGQEFWSNPNASSTGSPFSGFGVRPGGQYDIFGQGGIFSGGD